MRRQEEQSEAQVVVGKEAGVGYISHAVVTVIFVFTHLSVSHSITECFCICLDPS